MAALLAPFLIRGAQGGHFCVALKLIRVVIKLLIELRRHEIG